jgi:tetratricopeptide (TPR) repeat protein
MRGAAVIAAMTLCAACHKPGRIESVIEEAGALAAEGRVEQGAALLAEAAAAAEHDDDRDQLLFQQGLLYARALMVDEAMSVWTALYESTTTDNLPGRIAYEQGMLMREVGELAQAERHFTRVVTEHPEHGLADTALLRLQKLVRERAGDQAERELLEGLLPGALESDFGDDVLWALYVWHRDHGEDEVARQYLLAIRKSYPFPTGGRCVDALFALARMAEDEGRYDKVEQYLREIIGPTGESPLIGSSAGGARAEALLWLGRIYEAQHGDLETALSLYEEVVTMGELTTIGDDGLFEVARVLHEMGEDERACTRIEQLFEDFPYSNQHDEAAALADEMGCGAAAGP